MNAFLLTATFAACLIAAVELTALVCIRRGFGGNELAFIPTPAAVCGAIAAAGTAAYLFTLV